MRRLALAAWLGLGAAAGAVAAPLVEEAPKVGYLAPAFSLPDLAGNTLKSADLKDKVLLVNFWASWCGPCLAEMPALDKLQAAFPVTEFTVLGLAQDTEAADVTDFLKQSPVSFPILLDDSQAVSRAYQVRGLPATYLVNKHGIIVERMLGPREWDSKEWRGKIKRLIEKKSQIQNPK